MPSTTGVISDPIADMLTRIRNGLIARKETVLVPHSRVKLQIGELLVQEGYVDGVEVVPAGPQPDIAVALKYTPEQRPVITGLRRVSRPGLRVYAGRRDLPRVQGGLGVAVISTSRGVMTDRDARRTRVGGEVLCEVW